MSKKMPAKADESKPEPKQSGSLSIVLTQSQHVLLERGMRRTGLNRSNYIGAAVEAFEIEHAKAR